MSDWALVDFGLDGSKIYHRVDGDGKGTFKVVYPDADKLLDMNKKARNAESGNWKGDMHHVAAIPPGLWRQWWEEFGGNPMSTENQPKLMAKLNSSEYRDVRVKSGRI